MQNQMKSLKKKLMKMMKFRELSKNESALLIILSIVVLFWMSYKFIYINQSEKLQALKSKRTQYEVDIKDMNKILRKENSIKSEWKDLKREKDIVVSNYFPTLDQPQIIYLLNELIDDEDIDIEDINFKRPELTDIEGFQVNSMEISIPYRGNYMGIMNILDSINGSSRKIMVDNLSMDANADNGLSGTIDFRVYSLEGIVDSDPNIIYVDNSLNEKKENPFKAYDYKNEEVALNDKTDVESVSSDKIDSVSKSEDENFKNGEEESLDLSSSSDSRNSPKSSKSKEYKSTSTIPSKAVNYNDQELIADFEAKNSHLLPSKDLVKENINIYVNSISNEYSLKLEYNTVNITEENITFIDITKNNIEIKSPPTSFGIWIYSYEYSSITIGIKFKGASGEDVFLSLSEGIDWIGWKYVEMLPISEFELYPMKLENLYLEVPESADSQGVILINQLQAIYPEDIAEDENADNLEQFIFHVVDLEDTVESISEFYYGNTSFTDEIMKFNMVKGDEVLRNGRVLLLKEH